MVRSSTARRTRRTSPESRSSTSPRSTRRCSGRPRSPPPAAVHKRSASSGPIRPSATDRGRVAWASVLFPEPHRWLSGLRRLDVVDRAHRGDARVPRRLLAARDDAGREPRGPATPRRRLPHPEGFTYTVLDPARRDVIGCVYIYPLPDSDYGACALSWVRKSHAHLDTRFGRSEERRVGKEYRSRWAAYL